jgi:hypothetical protein
MKVIGWIVGIIVLAIVAVGAYLVLNAGDVVKAAVERLGPRYLGVPVSLSSADISFTEGSGELRGLVIGNPDGFDGPHSLKIGRAAVTLDPSQISDQLVVIKALEVDGAEVAIVAKGTRTNLQTLMDNLGPSEASAEPEPETASEMKMIIDRFAFTNAKTTLESDIIGSKSVSIPDIQLTDIGRKTTGVTAREAVKQLLRPITRAATEAVAKEGIGVDVDGLKKQANEKLQEGIGSGLDKLKKRLN